MQSGGTIYGMSTHYQIVHKVAAKNVNDTFDNVVSTHPLELNIDWASYTIFH